MAVQNKAFSNLPEAVVLRRQIPVREAAALVGVHEDTFRRHYPQLIKKFGPRLDRVTLGDVLAIGQSKG